MADEEQKEGGKRSGKRPRGVSYWLLMALHAAIIANFAFEILYAGYMVFVVVRPEGVSGPLGQQAMSIPFELMTTRRLYAIEFWIAMAGLAIYLALTEIGPRLRRYREHLPLPPADPADGS